VFLWGTFVWELVSYSKVCVGVNVGERIGVCVCVCRTSMFWKMKESLRGRKK
jgi:hypothetical protein